MAEGVWDVAVAGERVPAEMLLATKTAAGVVDDVQRVAGGTAIYETSPIERCFRGVHTVTQHAVISHRNLELGGGWANRRRTRCWAWGARD